MTGTGKFTPRMLSKPWVELSLKSRPAGLAETDFKYAIGVGTNFDFNVFLKSEAYGQFLPKGVYEFTYTANLKEETSIGNAVGAGA